MPRLGDFLNYTSNSGPTKFLYFFFSKRTCNGLETFHNYNIKEDIDTEKVVPLPIISLKWEGGGQPTLYGVTKPVYTFENNFLRSDDLGGTRNLIETI